MHDLWWEPLSWWPLSRGACLIPVFCSVKHCNDHPHIKLGSHLLSEVCSGAVLALVSSPVFHFIFMKFYFLRPTPNPKIQEAFALHYIFYPPIIPLRSSLGHCWEMSLQLVSKNRKTPIQLFKSVPLEAANGFSENSSKMKVVWAIQFWCYFRICSYLPFGTLTGLQKLYRVGH